MKIGFITCGDLSRYFPDSTEPHLTQDDAPLARYMRDQDHEVEPVVWGADIECLLTQGFNGLVVRSPWDYMDSVENSRRFFDWLKQLDASSLPLRNPFSALKWSFDKHYLRDMEDLGVAIVPTTYVEVDQELTRESLKQYLSEHGSFVLKPCISAAAKDTFLIEADSDVDRMESLNGKVGDDFQSWRGGRSFMLQPFLSEIEESGEWSLVFFGGEYSHAVHKLPQKGHWLVQDELGGSVRSGTPPDGVLAAAKKVMDRLSHFSNDRWGMSRDQLLYTRVDLMFCESEAVLGEIEMIEPELFFVERLLEESRLNFPAAKKFTDVLIRSLKQ